MKALRAFQSARFLRHCETLHRIARTASTIALGLFWTTVATLIPMYIVGIMMMEGVQTYLREEWLGRTAAAAPEDLEWLSVLRDHYGTLLLTMQTLFRAVSGADWTAYASTLSRIGKGWTVIWTLYIFCLVFGVSNVLTGIVVDILKRPTPNDHILAEADGARDVEKFTVVLTDELAREGFAADVCISQKMFMRLIRTARVREHLRACGIGPDTAYDAYFTIDADRMRELDAGTMAKHIMGVRGQAKASDWAVMSRRLFAIQQTIDTAFDALAVSPAEVKNVEAASMADDSE